jgi:multicomponent Na+:H+ antiporter subunit D
MRYLMMQILSGVLLISGVAMTGLAEGSFILSEIGRLQDGVLVGVFDLDAPGTLLILAAVGIKAGFPLAHTWLQDAYPNTTETGAVVMSAYTTTLAVYVLARGFAGLDALIWIGAVMTIYPIFFAVIENDLRKVLAFSTNNQIGFMVCAVGVGTPLALNGAAAHAVAHIVFKGLLFMAMGAVWMRTGSTRATDLGGLHRTMPFTALFCLIGAASISALPLLSGFASKSMIMSSVHSGEGLMLVWLMLLFASAGVLEHSGIKIPYFAFFSHDSGRRPEEAPFNMLLAMGLSAGLCLSIGMSPAWFYERLPYRDVAREYLVQDLFTLEHILTQLQLLAFAVLAFLLLKRAGLYPPEAPGIILDVDWVWRRGWPLAAGPVRAPLLGVLRSVAAAGRDVLGRVGAMMAEVFSPAGALASRASAVSGAVWAVALLAIVVIISVVSLT